MPFNTEKRLGFGLMRLPTLEDKSIDLETLKKMVDLYMEHGFNYFDTAYLYHGGASETAIRQALVERYPREAYTLATKLPSWVIEEDISQVQQVFDDQLQKTGAGYFDYYLLHAVATPRIPVYDRQDCWNFCKRMKAEGKIRYYGFSFHDTADVLTTLLDAHPDVDFVQLQLNYFDWENDLVQARACYEEATRRGIPVVVMEPIKGGTLVNLPEKAEALLKATDPVMTPAAWALRFAASLPNVKMVLSGMSNLAQMEENLAAMEAFTPITEQEKELLFAAAKIMLETPMIPCTACGYCMDNCPQNIPIPSFLKYLNNRNKFGWSIHTRTFYNTAASQGNLASACIGCGSCESLCPQKIDIIKHLKEAAEVFES